MIGFSRKALKELVSEVLNGTNLAGGTTVGATEPVQPNPIVDPTTAATDPNSQSYVPRNKAEFTVALGRLTDGMGDEDFPALYQQVQAALEAIEGSDEEQMTKNRVATVAKPGNVEEAVRRAVRKMIAEAMPGRDLGYSGPDTYALATDDGEPWKVYGFTPKGTRKAQPDASFEDEDEAIAHMNKLKKRDSAAKYVVVDETPEVRTPAREKGDWSVPKGDDGAEFKDIAATLGMSQMGAQAAAARAMKRFGHMFKMMFGGLDGEDAQPEEAELLVLTAAKDFIESLNDDKKAQKIFATLTGRDMQVLLPDSVDAYRDYMESSGELAPADVQLLRDHPTMLTGLEGYPEFVRTELLGDLQAEVADLPNDIDRLTGLDAFREFLSSYVKESVRDWNGDEDA